MKALTLLPRDIKLRYDINRKGNTIFIHYPDIINVKVDNTFKIEETSKCWEIRNSKVWVTLWKNTKVRHIAIL